jgi:DivIVA domain-containing protein
VAISFPRADPATPSTVAAATFRVARRGFDQTEVRDFLRAVAAELTRLHDREQALQREVEELRQQLAAEPRELDEQALTAALGEETARVLQTARDAALLIRQRAEDEARTLLRTAQDEADRFRREAELESDRRRRDAGADAEAEIELAKQQGREMVNEARRYRETVLADLAQRRGMAREQIDALVHGRDRLVQAFERARLAAVDVLADIGREDRPELFVNLDPTTGPVPMLVPAEQVSEPEPRPAPEPEPDPTPHGDPEPDADIVTLPEPSLTTDAAASDTDDRPPAPVVALFADPPTRERRSVDDLFAQLRAASVDTVAAAVSAEEAPPEPEPEPDHSEPSPRDLAFHARSATLAPIVATVARLLKRTLADEQNEALHTMQRSQPIASVDDLVGAETQHLERYAAVVATELTTAGFASRPTDPAVAHLAEQLVLPLRERLEHGVEVTSGDHGELGAYTRNLYRDWKRRLDAIAEYIVLDAHGTASFDDLEPGAPVVWHPDPAGASCTDASVNAAVGALPAGDEFPSGHRHPPTGSGCRCLLVPADR